MAKEMKKVTKPMVKKPVGKVKKEPEKFYADFHSIQKEAPRKLNTVAKTVNGVSYKLINLVPPVWKKM